MAYPNTLDDFTPVVDNVDDVMAIDINELQTAIESIEAKVGVDGSAVTGSIDYKVNNFFVTGRKMWLYENTAPTGWSIVGISDVTLAVKGGAGLYNVTGGNVAGETWANLKAHTHTGPSHTHGATGLSAPNHTHTLANGTAVSDKNITTSGPIISDGEIRNYQNDGAIAAYRPSVTTGNPTATAVTGSTAADGTAATGAQSTADVRPTAAVGIVVTKT